MGLADELYVKMLEVSYTARRHKIPELGENMLYTARKCLPIWRENEHSIAVFAREVLRIRNIPSAEEVSLRATMTVRRGQLPEPVASACWRLISLLEYIAEESEL